MTDSTRSTAMVGTQTTAPARRGPRNGNLSVAFLPRPIIRIAGHLVELRYAPNDGHLILTPPLAAALCDAWRNGGQRGLALAHYATRHPTSLNRSS